MILGLELTDFWGTVNTFRDAQHRTSRSRVRPGTRLISITAVDLFTKSNFQDFQRYPEVDVAMAADAEATLPALTEACRKLADRRPAPAFAERRARLEQAHARAREVARAEAAHAWDAIADQHRAAVRGDLWAQIRNDDWSLVSESGNASGWIVPVVELRQALPAPGRLGRRRRRLRRARGRGRRAGQSRSTGGCR